jgi:hypothetical protein
VPAGAGDLDAQWVRAAGALDAVADGIRELARVVLEIRSLTARPPTDIDAASGAAGPSTRRTQPKRTTSRRLNELVEERRQRFEPASVRLLFVASPPDPSDRTNFYLANSHLFRSMRGAFAKAFGPDIPRGEGFLGYFRDAGGWIVELPPVLRRRRGRPSSKTRTVETDFAAGVMRRTKARHVVAFRESLGQTVKAAAAHVGIPAENVYVLATPTDVLRESFSAILRAVLESNADRPRRRVGSTAARKPFTRLSKLGSTETGSVTTDDEARKGLGESPTAAINGRTE